MYWFKQLLWIFYIFVSEDFGGNAQEQNILRAKACKENMFCSKGYFSSPEDMMGCFFLERSMLL